MSRQPPRSTQSRSSAASDVYKRQTWEAGDVWLEAGAGTAVDWASVARADLAQAVPPGGSAVVRVSLSAPSAPGECLLYLSLIHISEPTRPY